MKNKFFQLARKLAQKSNYKPHKLGAVIVNGNSVEGLGFNKNKTHPRSKTLWKTLHAELSAVLSAGREDLSGCDIYVYRETKSGIPSNSFPCEHCFQMLQELNIKTIYYTDEGKFKSYLLT